MSDFYCRDIETHDTHLQNCVALTNKHAMHDALRRCDGDFLRKEYALQKEEGQKKEIDTKKRKHQEYLRRKLKQQRIPFGRV